ncbi:5-formyltetrahydrofolate cyclo-ligase [Actinosynnema sp. NPDC050436]|uniref:5-formyltetrahydrofolate cyclo-ligase n=1 Tax=Actinosynnema sp. NPDC050436 TaxID=3155659 RepID=UPI0033F19907
MTSDQRNQKTTLRTRFRAARRTAEPAPLSSEALSAVGAFGVVAGQTVCAYLAIGGEPGSLALLDALRSGGYRVLLPIVVGDAALDWALYDGALRAGPFGLREPAGEPLGASAIGSAALVLVPALAVDHRGVRLGQGGGHYDRSLPMATGPLVGLVRDEEFVPSLPAEPHDVRLNAVLTPGSGVIHLPL